MPHFKFEPRKELEFMAERMKRFVDEFPESFSLEFGKTFSPRTDIMHDDANVYVHVELPGVEKEQIKLQVKTNSLSISGVKSLPENYEQLQGIDIERNYGEFLREIKLPEEVDKDSVQGKLANGILSVTLKKVQTDTSKEINIEID